MKQKSRHATSIIGGADGPTSIFIASGAKKKTLKMRIRDLIYKCNYKRMEKRISAGTHTLEEVVAYANTKYHTIEFSITQRIYTERKKNIKEHLILKYKPELLGDMKELPKPDVYTEESLRKLHEQIQLRSKMIVDIPDHEMPIDFHVYEITIKDGRIEIEIEYIWNIFSVSYSGSKKAMKQLKKIAQDLYLYYGVTEEDIRNRSERYTSLLTTLSV